MKSYIFLVLTFMMMSSMETFRNIRFPLNWKKSILKIKLSKKACRLMLESKANTSSVVNLLKSNKINC